jgi:putative ATP-binding cassette transporter
LAGFVKSLLTIWRIAMPYFCSEEQRRARILLISVIAMELGLVAVTVLLNRWYNGFYGALQDRNWSAFVYQITYFCGIAVAATVLTAYKQYLNQWLEIRWRRWMTNYYLEHWLTSATHYRMQLIGDRADNPDQRIAEDIRLFIERTLTISVGFLSAMAVVASFIVILWILSADAPLHLYHTTFAIPGYLVWTALVYALFGTAVSHLIGRALIGLNFNQQRYEADFRFNLVRVRENSEQIALLGGEPMEIDRLRARFEKVAANWYLIMSRQKRLSFFTVGFTQVAIVFPIIVVSPTYFAGVMQLGGLMQTATAFATVQTALSYFVTIYRDFAEWRAVIARLDGFERAIGTAREVASRPSRVEVVSHPTKTELTIAGLSVQLPTGAPLVGTENLVIKAGQTALITGPSGSGKSTLFRAVAGVWPFGVGTIVVPAGAKVMMLPQRPYFAVASLEEAVSYPAEPDTFGSARISEVLQAVGLPALASRLSEEAHWNQILSLGEQQRLSIARAILHTPDYFFLDEATASLDEQSEAKLYALLQERLPGVTIISIGHRSTLFAFHDRRFALHPGHDSHYVRETEGVTN